MLFESACDMYITDRRKRLRMNTIEGYESAIRCHLLPRWSGREIESISDTELQDWADGFELPGAAEKAFKTFRQVIRWSMRKLRLRMYDPTMAGIELPKKQPYRPKVLDAAGERSYLRALYGHECEAVAICSVTLGLRRGEACGLRWEDIDLRTGEVRARRSRQVVSGEVVEVPPKTAKSARSCWLPRFAVQGLKAIRNGARGLLCELDPDTVARRIKAACRRAGAEWVSMTSCRHTWATLAVETGVGIETIAMMMGHSDITTAYEHYIVPRPKICKDAQKAIERLVLSS